MRRSFQCFNRGVLTANQAWPNRTASPSERNDRWGGMYSLLFTLCNGTTNRSTKHDCARLGARDIIDKIEKNRSRLILTVSPVNQ